MQENTIVIRENHTIHLVNFMDIVYCKGEGRYTKIILDGGKSYIVAKLINCVEKILPSDYFFRIHKSYIVNMNEVSTYNVDGRYCIMTKNHPSLKVSRRRHPAFKNFIHLHYKII